MVVGFRLHVGGNDVGAGDCTEQDTVTELLKPLTSALTVIIYVAEEPAFTVFVVGWLVKPNGGPENETLITLLPPKANGLGSGGPNELTMMK